MSDPSILKWRVRDLPPVFVQTVNGVSPDSNGEITLVVTTPVDPDANNLLTSSVAGLMVDKRASEHSFDTVGTTLVSTNVQWVINELDTRDISIQSQLWTAQGDIGNLQTDLWSVTTRVTTAEWEIDTLQSDLSTLTGNALTWVSDTATMNLVKTGNSISADVMIKSDIHNLIESTPNGLYADNKAENLSYSNLATGIVSNTVQWAIDEVAFAAPPIVSFTPTLLSSTTSAPATLLNAWYKETANEVEMFIACTLPSVAEMLVISNLPANIVWYVMVQGNQFVSSSNHHLIDRRTNDTTSITIQRYDAATLSANAELTVKIIYQK